MIAQSPALRQDAGGAILFAPDTKEVYSAGFETSVEPGELAKPLCGAFRPGHFGGVATVACKLFNMVQPDVAFFGQKDFQQCAVVRRMTVELNLPIKIMMVPTVREADDLALSSRNRYLVKSSAGSRQQPRPNRCSGTVSLRRTRRSPAASDGKAAFVAVDQLEYLALVALI